MTSQLTRDLVQAAFFPRGEDHDPFLFQQLDRIACDPGAPSNQDDDGVEFVTLRDDLLRALEADWSARGEVTSTNSDQPERPEGGRK